MKRKSMSRLATVAIVALATTATTIACYYDAWTSCPAHKVELLEKCPDDSGNYTDKCDPSPDSESVATTLGVFPTSGNCGLELLGSSCSYQCYDLINGQDYPCGTLVVWHTNSIPNGFSDECNSLLPCGSGS
jgi:hypothetical protein